MTTYLDCVTAATARHRSLIGQEDGDTDRDGQACHQEGNKDRGHDAGDVDVASVFALCLVSAVDLPPSARPRPES